MNAKDFLIIFIKYVAIKNFCSYCFYRLGVKCCQFLIKMSV